MTFLKAGVVCLVLANVMYFLWARGVAGTRDADSGAAPTASLRLITEARGASTAPRAGAAGSVAAGGAIPAGTNAADGNSAGPDGAGAPGGLAASDAAATGAGSAELLPNGLPVTVATANNLAADPPIDAVAPGVHERGSRCITVGPFADVAAASRASATLRSGGYQPRQRVTEGEVWAGLWVYLPLPATSAAGEQIKENLKAGGIDDVLEMPGPNDKPVISLGLFSDPHRAQARVAQAQALGLHPGISDRKRTGDVYWVDVDLKPTDTTLNPADFHGESGRIVRLEVKACPAADRSGP